MVTHIIKIDNSNLGFIPKEENVDSILENIWTYLTIPFRIQKGNIFNSLDDIIIYGGSGLKSSIEELEYVFKKYDIKYKNLYVSEIIISNEHSILLFTAKLKFNFSEE